MRGICLWRCCSGVCDYWNDFICYPCGSSHILNFSFFEMELIIVLQKKKTVVSLWKSRKRSIQRTGQQKSKIKLILSIFQSGWNGWNLWMCVGEDYVEFYGDYFGSTKDEFWDFVWNSKLNLSRVIDYSWKEGRN